MPYDRDVYRRNQVQDYISVFYPELKKGFEDCTVLDVGSGTGSVSLSLARYSRNVVGIEPNEEYVKRARAKAIEMRLENATFLQLTADDYHTEDRYDVVILSDVLEHVERQRELLVKCLSLLEEGGVLYLNTPNKWYPMEPHFRLPFLSWLPDNLANHYAMAFRGGGYNGYHLLGYRDLINLLESLDTTYSFKVQPNPRRLMYRLGNRLVTKAPFLWRFANAFQVIVQKR